MAEIAGLPDGFKARRRGSCAPAAIALLDQLKDGRDWVVEGWVSFSADPHASMHEHTWLEIAGIVYDPTQAQFRSFQTFRKNELIFYHPRGRISIWRAKELAHAQFWGDRAQEFMPRGGSNGK